MANVDPLTVLWRLWGAVLAFLTFAAGAIAETGENEKRNVDSIYVLDVSQSMVDSVQRVLASKGLARFVPGRVELGNPKKIENFLAASANKSFVKDNILYRNVRLLEQLIDEYEQGNIYIILFDHGPQDRGPIKAVTGPFHVRSLHDPVKAELKSLLDPHRNGPYAKARDWRGIFVETVFRGSGPTLINTTCEAAMKIFEAALRQPGYTNETYSQQLLLFTDGEELERGKTFPVVLERFNLQRRNIWFEYREIYLGPKPSVETAGIHQQLSDAGFRPIYLGPDLWRRIRVSGSGQSLTGQATIPHDNAGVLSVRTRVRPPVRLKIQADDQKPVEGRIVFKLGECSPPLPGLKLSVRPESLPVSNLPDELELELLAEGNRAALDLAETTTAFLNVRWDLELPPSEKPDDPGAGNLAHSEQPYVDYGGRHHLPITLQLTPEQRFVRIRAMPPSGPGHLEGGTLEIKLDDLESSGRVLSFEADFSDAGTNARSRLVATADPPATLVFDGGKSSLELSPVESGLVFPFWLSANAAGGQATSTVTLLHRALSPHLILYPTQIVVSVSFRTPSASVVFYGTNSVAIPAPEAINWGEIWEHHAARGATSPADGGSFEVRLPPNLAPEAGVTVSLTSDALKVFRLVLASGNSEEAFENGATVHASSKFRIKLKQDVVPRENVERFSGDLVIAPFASVLLNSKPDKIVVPLSVSIKQSHVER